MKVGVASDGGNNGEDCGEGLRLMHITCYEFYRKINKLNKFS